ncbi:hypothetical protein ACT3CD_12290 [Geofilum sp. OHC36d9]|uniref:hypothetical protein n=1 Tax=Geofilum sp. OHC36d9 TaxID=3458413 RepID=UPI0040347E75
MANGAVTTAKTDAGSCKSAFLWTTEDQSSNRIRVQAQNIGLSENNENRHDLKSIPATGEQVGVSFE